MHVVMCCGDETAAGAAPHIIDWLRMAGWCARRIKSASTFRDVATREATATTTTDYSVCMSSQFKAIESVFGPVVSHYHSPPLVVWLHVGADEPRSVHPIGRVRSFTVKAISTRRFPPFFPLLPRPHLFPSSNFLPGQAIRSPCLLLSNGNSAYYPAGSPSIRAHPRPKTHSSPIIAEPGRLGTQAPSISVGCATGSGNPDFHHFPRPLSSPSREFIFQPDYWSAE